jgi:hypothetical protein
MAEKLSMKSLAADIEEIRARLAKLEKQPAVEKPKARATGTRKELTADQRHALVETLAHFKAARRSQTGRAGDAESDWLEAEGEVAVLLATLVSDA